MAKFGKNKKGSLIDLFFIGVVLLLFSVFVLIGLRIGSAFNDKVQEMPIFEGNASNAAQDTVTNYTNSINYGFLTLTIFIGIAVLVLAALVRIHPIFIPLFFIGWILLIFVTGVFSNIYTEMASTTQLTSTAADLVIITWILGRLPMIVGVFGVILMVVMYKLRGMEQ